MMSLFASSTASTDDNTSPIVPCTDVAEMTLSPKSPTSAACISPGAPTTSKAELLSSNTWTEIEVADGAVSGAPGEEPVARNDMSNADVDVNYTKAEVARLRCENESLTTQLHQMHDLLQQHAKLVEDTAAEISPTVRKPQPTSTKTWWDAATRTFRSAQSDEAVRATEKQVIKTVVDATRRATETAAEGAVDEALAALGHSELAPAADRMIDINAGAISEEVVAYADSLIDATAPPMIPSPPTSADTLDAEKAGDSNIAEATSGCEDMSAAPEQPDSPDCAQSSSSVLADWSQWPTTKIGWFSVVAASLVGLYAVRRCGQPHVARVLTAVRAKLPAGSAELVAGSGGSSGAFTSSTLAQLDAEESLSLAPVLVSLGQKAVSHVPGEGLPEMLNAGLGEAGHSF